MPILLPLAKTVYQQRLAAGRRSWPSRRRAIIAGMEYVITVDLGGTFLRAALVTARGEILAHERIPTEVEAGPAAVIGRIVGLIERMHARLPEGAAMLGVGIGAPGPLDPATGTVYSPPNMPGWHTVPLRSMIAEATGLPVELGNDANVAALGEWRFGGGQGCRDLVYVTVSTGIGGGVISDGRLLLGRMGAGAELGFMILDAEGGTVWEDLASGTALGRAAAAAMPARPESLLHQRATPATVTGADVAAAAAAGDALAAELMDREARLLGLGFASILHIFSPEIVIAGGGVILNNPGLLERARAIAYAHVKVALYRDVPIIAATLGDNAGLLGAAALVLAARER
ncbi:MAG: ROK family protein [Oscillochloridaceae bacterium]|nr:ROK family protein [Chloroflexaceae bacterium]MDW8391360.1 ROK family protein [Oscillochloridaceae bacterium]